LKKKNEIKNEINLYKKNVIKVCRTCQYKTFQSALDNAINGTRIELCDNWPIQGATTENFPSPKMVNIVGISCETSEGLDENAMRRFRNKYILSDPKKISKTKSKSKTDTIGPVNPAIIYSSTVKTQYGSTNYDIRDGLKFTAMASGSSIQNVQFICKPLKVTGTAAVARGIEIDQASDITITQIDF